MGLYDREYYRRDMREPPGVTPGRALGLSMTAWLIIANVAVFFFDFLLTKGRSSLLGAWWRETLYLHPFDVFARGHVWQPLTSMFLHADFFHILFNMWFLYIFGKGIENLYGRRNFLAFYLCAGIFAGLAYSAIGVVTRNPTPAIGASGGVMGVVVLYAFHFPYQRLYVWGILPVLVWQLAAFFVGLDLLYFLGGAGGNVANAAHLGGALFGAIYRFVDLRFDSLLARLKGLVPDKRPASRPRPPAPPPPAPRIPPPGADPEVRRRVDVLLDKISRHGLSSLTDEERDFLRNASKQYRG